MPTAEPMDGARPAEPDILADIARDLVEQPPFHIGVCPHENRMETPRRILMRIWMSGDKFIQMATSQRSLNCVGDDVARSRWEHAFPGVIAGDRHVDGRLVIEVSVRIR